MSPSLNSRERREFASEVKFLVSPSLAEQICGWVRGRLMPDSHASSLVDGYRVTSLYFDTPQLDVFHRQGSYGRCKYRIRRYDRGEVAFLERKLKNRGLLAKRRTTVPLQELELLNHRESARDWPGHWFHRRRMARQIMPVCRISYRRTAFVAMTPNGPIRLTLDNSICAQPADAISFDEIRSGVVVLPNQVIMELKFLMTMPTLFKRLVEEFALTPQPVSKYRIAATELGLASAPAARREGPHA